MGGFGLGRLWILHFCKIRIGVPVGDNMLRQQFVAAPCNERRSNGGSDRQRRDHSQPEQLADRKPEPAALRFGFGHGGSMNFKTWRG
jgi:hypothetical protein